MLIVILVGVEMTLMIVDYFSLIGPRVERPSEEFKQLTQKLKEFVNRRSPRDGNQDSKD
jgi:hypothetical protein